MIYVNKAILLGKLQGKPDTYYTQSGSAITTIHICTKSKWTDTQGVPKESAEWHRVVVIGGAGEFLSKNAYAGANVYVEGEIKTRTYTKNGAKEHSTEIYVSKGGKVAII